MTASLAHMCTGASDIYGQTVLQYVDSKLTEMLPEYSVYYSYKARWEIGAVTEVGARAPNVCVCEGACEGPSLPCVSGSKMHLKNKFRCDFRRDLPCK